MASPAVDRLKQTADPHTSAGNSSAIAARFDVFISAIVVAGAIVLVLVPVAYIFFGSFRTAAPGSPHAGFTLQNWITVYGSPDYLIPLANTVMLSGLTAALSIVVGGTLAWIIARTDAPWRNQLALLLVVPLMISNLITALAWVALAAPNAGLINALLRAVFGIRTTFNIYSFGGIVLVLTLHFSSLAFLAFFAALRSVNSSLEEASYMLGAGPLRTAIKMTLPLIWPTIAATFLIIFVSVAENFSVPALLGGPVGFYTLPSQIFLDMEAVEPSNPTVAAATGTMLLWIAALGVMWQRRILRNASRYVTIVGKSGGSYRLVRLGPWRYAATGFVILFLLLGAGLPYVVLVLGSFLGFVTSHITPSILTLDNYRRLFSESSLFHVRNSLLLAGLGGLAATVFYVFLTYFIGRLPRRFAAAADILTIVPNAIPAMVIGVGLVWAFVGSPLPIYGTPVILVIAYFTRWVGFGVRHSQAALTQVSAELTEAARISGASPLMAFRHITLPLIRPAMLSLWTMLFIFIFMEISATIILYSPDTATLPVILWNNMTSGYQTRAYAVAVLQTTIIFVVLYVTNRLFDTLRNTLERQ